MAVRPVDGGAGADAGGVAGAGEASGRGFAGMHGEVGVQFCGCGGVPEGAAESGEGDGAVHAGECVGGGDDAGGAAGDGGGAGAVARWVAAGGVAVDAGDVRGGGGFGGVWHRAQPVRGRGADEAVVRRRRGAGVLSEHGVLAGAGFVRAVCAPEAERRPGDEGPWAARGVRVHGEQGHRDV